MTTSSFKPYIPEIAGADRTPLVQALLEIIAQQQSQIQALEERVGKLEDELRRTKGGSKRPKLKPSQLEANGQDTEGNDGQGENKSGRGKRKRRKTGDLPIHEERRVVAPEVPAGWRFKGYRRFVVQDLKIELHNTCYLLEQWQSPTGESLSAQVPAELQGRHFGPTLASFVLHQYHHNHVTQPLLLEQLRDFGVEISAGQLNRLLTEEQDRFHQEKAELKVAGLAVSSYVQTDDTGARHAGANGYCTFIGNDLFAWFETTSSKSRVNFLKRLQPERRYVIDAEALAYMQRHGLAESHRQILAARGQVTLSDPEAWRKHLQGGAVLGKQAQRIATEGALIGGLLAQGLAGDLAVLSDDAGQFNVFAHALCWIHAERGINQLLPLTDQDRRAIAWVRQQLWTLYGELKSYKIAPSEARKAHIGAGFDALCATQTTFAPLNQALHRLAHNRDELLLVLERPELPLHNNLSEQALRDYVKKRKISGSTRSDLGRRCRDTFASLKKTCRQHGLSFWAYLKDRVSGANVLPSLADTIRQAAQAPP